MDILESHIDATSDDFRANAAHHEALSRELGERLARVREGGDRALREKHESRGKLFVRERIERLLGPATPFLELSPLAANGLYDDAAPAAGLVPGGGRIHGR